MMQKYTHTAVALLIAVLFWLGQRAICLSIESCGSFTLLPQEPAVLSISLFIFVSIVAMGMYADYHRQRLLAISQENDPRRIYTAMVYAMHHILNNFFNGMELVRMEAQGSEDFDQRILDLYDQASKEAIDLIRKLSELEEISESVIMGHVHPRMNPTKMN